jgi:hypothetical protein
VILPQMSARLGLRQGPGSSDGSTTSRYRCSSPVFLREGSLTRETGLNTQSPGLTFEFWRERNKIRGRFIGGNGVAVAKLNGDGLLNRKPDRRLTIGADDRICCNQPNDNPRARIPSAERIPLFVQCCKHLRRQE